MIIKRCHWSLILLPMIIWLNIHHNAFLLSSITFFCLGALFSIKEINLWTFFEKTRNLISIGFAVCALIDFYVHVFNPTSINLQIHRITIIIGLFISFKMANDFIINGYNTPKSLTKSSFFVFTIHYPIVLAIRKMTTKLLNTNNDYVNILLYWGDVFIVIFSCLILFKISMKYAKTFTNIALGSR